MKILITGGHFSPAYSIISELKKRGHVVAIAGRAHPFEGDSSLSLEYAICKKENLQFFEIKAGRFQRKFGSYTISSLLKTPLGFVQALMLVKRAQPDVVMTFGGYIGLPISYAASTLGVPVILHEQTQGAGLAARLIGKVARKICISFKTSENSFPNDKIEFTGNPVRSEIFEINKNSEIAKTFPTGKAKIIYVTGGSTGSHFINSQMKKIIDTLLEKFIVVHQTGESSKYNDFEELNKLRNKLENDKKQKYVLKKFIYPDEIGFVFEHADLIISRAGANTILEIIAKKKMSLLIPLPHGQTSEQLANAKFLKGLGISEYLEEQDAAPDALIKKIQEMFTNEKKYISNMLRSENYFVPDAAKRIVNIIEEDGKKNS